MNQLKSSIVPVVIIEYDVAIMATIAIPINGILQFLRFGIANKNSAANISPKNKILQK